MKKNDEIEIAVIIPALNEEKTISKVVKDFKKNLPESKIYVFDNNSDDNTFNEAINAGAIVIKECSKGKGNVVRRMFSEVNADIYIMVDGDDTYEASIAPLLIQKLVDNNLDMVNALRINQDEGAYRRGHKFGNFVLSNIVQMIFGRNIKDLLSGYRVFSKRFVKSFPAHSKGFEIETELTIHCLEMRLPMDEVNTEYLSRPTGSESKLSTWKDGFRILFTILKLLLGERPFISFLLIAFCLGSFGSILGWLSVVQPWINNGQVIRLPSAVLSTGLITLSFLSLISGIIIHYITQTRKEIKRFTYLLINNSNFDDQK